MLMMVMVGVVGSDGDVSGSSDGRWGVGVMVMLVVVVMVGGVGKW